MTLIILPPRKTVGGASGFDAVTSLNGLRGDLSLDATGGLQITPFGGSILTISPIAGMWVLRGGDTFTGNLQFTPTGGAYGLRLFSSSTDPIGGDSGGLYYNSTDKTLRIFDGGHWAAMAQLGALTPTQADARYLRLDASNGPLTGDLSLGSTRLGLGTLAADPASGTLGQIFFNSTLDSARVRTSSGWTNLGGGISSVTVGSGLLLNGTPGGTLTSSGTLSLDLSASPTWGGFHTFSKPVVFAASQTFAVSSLLASGQAAGDLLVFDTGSWGRLPVGTPGQALTVNAATGKPAWGTVASSGGTLGTPSDAGTTGNPATGYEDGFFPFTAATTIADAVDRLNELVAQIAPAKANPLTAQTLAAASPTLYTVKLSAGLPSAWYQSGKTAGSTISSYFLGGSYTLTSPSQANTFKSGSAGKPATYGVLNHNRYNAAGVSTVETVDMTAYTGSPITSGALTLDAVSAYNSIWARSSAHITYTQGSEGYEGHTLQHSEAGETSKAEYWLDSYSTQASAAPSFSSSPSSIVAVPVDKWLSGVLYYGYGSTFNIAFAAAAGIFKWCYNAAQVAQISGVGMNAVSVQPTGVPNYNDTLDRTASSAVPVTLNAANQGTMNKFLTVTLYKASGQSSSQQSPLLRPVCTYGQTSTATFDSFFDEAQRLTSGGEGTATAFAYTQTNPLPSGNAQARNGALQYPVSADYAGSPTFSGPQEWARFFYKTSASNGTLTFGGLSNVSSDITAYGTGDINVLLYLENDALFYDLGVAVTDTPSGAARVAAKGGRFSFSGNSLTWSVGTNTTGPTSAGNLGRFRLIVLLRTANKSITTITSA